MQEVTRDNRHERRDGTAGDSGNQGPPEHDSNGRRVNDVANARNDGPRHSFGWQPRRLLYATPEKQDDEKRQIEKRIRGERGDRPGRRDNDAPDRRSEAAGDVVADAIECDGRGQRLRRYLFADGRLPRRPEQGHSTANDEASDKKEDRRHDA